MRWESGWEIWSRKPENLYTELYVKLPHTPIATLLITGKWGCIAALVPKGPSQTGACAWIIPAFGGLLNVPPTQSLMSPTNTSEMNYVRNWILWIRDPISKQAYGGSYGLAQPQHVSLPLLTFSFLHMILCVCNGYFKQNFARVEV